MGLYQVNQVLKGARNAGGVKTYAQASVVEKPSAAAISGTSIDFTGGTLEIEGVEYSIPDFDFAPFAALLKAGSQYVLAAVPSYVEPIDVTAAQLAGVNYFVTRTDLGESTLKYFLNPAAQSQIDALGGYDAVYDRVRFGVASEPDNRAFAFYGSERDKLADPKYTGQRVPIAGVEHVLLEVSPQDNSPKANVLTNYTFAQFSVLRATQGDIPADLRILTTAAAVAAYQATSRTFLAKRILGYTSLANANANVNAVELRIYNEDGSLVATPFSAPLNLVTGAAVAGITHFAVYEFFFPSWIEPGNIGTKDRDINVLDKSEALGLGRINPIYLANPFDIQKSSLSNAMARPSLTLYANPCSLVKVTVSSLGPVVLASLLPAYDTLI